LWVHFTGLKQSKKVGRFDSILRIVFETQKTDRKMDDEGSVEVHHSLAEGYHVGQYFIQFQRRIDNLI